ncbi:hypothetical protein [Solibacillus sp. FSL K6-4121]|uniref:hypothetical protein n=1 Tax=Solibacillus sp. FSL K6-4121 TaxID=2921505 RepID=UPI0030FA3375
MTIVVLFLVLLGKPTIYGDGREYLGMTISFSNHLTPNLTEEDIIERTKLEEKNGIFFSEDFLYAGYFEDLNEDYYSYHFWFYSLISVIPYFLLNLIGMNPLKVFQVVNGLLFIFLFYKIWKNSYLNEKGKTWLIVVSLFSPIILYIPWSHPEVFSYVFLTIGLLDFEDNKKKSAILYTTLASLQNPAIAFVALGMLFLELYRKKNILDKEWLSLVMISTIVFIPSIFYWSQYRVLNLIAEAGYSSSEYISLNKIFSLFIDPNFGMFIYIPLFFFIVIYLIFKRDIKVILTVILLFIIAVICSTQLNWNSGMMYINRYSVWLIPIVLVGTIHFIQTRNNKVFSKLLAAYVLTTGIITTVCVLEYDLANWLKYNSFTNLILSNVPMLYNPDPEVFAERALGAEKNYYEDLPISLINQQGARKTLNLNFEGELEYINGDINISLENELGNIKKFVGNQDIFNNSISAAFLKGSHPLEFNEGTPFRWFDKEAVIRFVNEDDVKESTVTFNVSSFYKKNDIKIYLNDGVIYDGEIVPELKNISIKVNLKDGLNELRIVAKNSFKPSEVDRNSNDRRDLSFNLSALEISNYKDIVNFQDGSFEFLNGWHGIENDGSGNVFRWTEKSSQIKMNSNIEEKSTLDMEMLSYKVSNRATIYFNGDLIYEGNITTDLQNIKLDIDLKQGGNILKIVSSGSQIPSVVDSASSDLRELSFYISSIIID